ncbi:MAG: hypothetical protein IKS02_08010 [Fibrobacter sp.]|nr:hypothetical protein [Fibrobacter sp.]
MRLNWFTLLLALGCLVPVYASVTFVVQFAVGDKNVATFSEDGLYAVDFKTINKVLVQNKRHGELDGIEIDKLCMFAASPDTLSDRVPAKAKLEPNKTFEIPIEVKDVNGNGIFDDGDTILFVGYGTSIWKRVDSEDSSFEMGKMDYFHSHSPYSFYQNFQLGWKSSGKGLRLGNYLKEPAGTGKTIQWMRYVRAEKEAILRDTYYGRGGDWESSSGREWFWLWHSRLDSTTYSNMDLIQPQVKNLPGLVSGGRGYLGVSFFPYRSLWKDEVEKEGDQNPDLEMSGKPYQERMENINFSATVNGKKMLRGAAKLMPGNTFRFDSPGYKAKDNAFGLTMLPNDYQFDRFDGYTVAYQWNPVVDSAEWLLPGRVSGVIQIPVGSGNNLQVMKFLNYRQEGLLQVKNGIAKDSVSSSDDVRYLVYKKGVYRKSISIVNLPAKPSGVLSDISRIDSRTEYLIISPQDFLNGAVTLGKFRSDGSAVTTIPTTVVSVEDIYSRYTGGALSPVAIRDYIAYAKTKCNKLKYVLLMGAGHYDYRGINTQLGKNFMPPYEHESVTSDDFFGALDPGELILYGRYDLDVAVGRLPVTSVQELSNYIEKVKDYEKVGSFDHSDWRSAILLAADDALNSHNVDYTEHTKLQEMLARSIDSMATAQGRLWNLKKIYLLDYPADAAGQKKDAVDDFINIMNQGALVTAYFGHGSMTDWASEGLLKPAYISKLSNRGRLTILNSFSCTVGRFDKGTSRSLSEEFVLASQVGSIASVGSTRETFADFNEPFGREFMINLLDSKGALIGDAYRKAKNAVGEGFSRQRYNNELYVLIGEPVIQTPKATMSVHFDKTIDTLMALDRVTLSGQVSGMKNGYVGISLREGKRNKKLFNGLEERPDSVDVLYDGALIYSQNVPVNGGKFQTEFISPRKLSFGDTAAQLSAWAYSSNDRTVGSFQKRNIIVSGVSAYADSIDDQVPPSIKIQTCYSGGTATYFADGETVKLQFPACLQVTIEDSTAIDFREQPDEGISFELVGVENPYHPTIFLEQTSKKVVMRKTFNAENYPEGKYVFKVRAQDVIGNVSTKTLNLELTEDMKSGLQDVFNIPNPMGKKGTTFYFKNLAVNRSSTVNIFIYNQNGRLVKVIKNAVSGVTRWDGRDNHGRLLANGLYHYVVRSEVEAQDSFKKKTWTKKQKLLISR